MLKCVKCGNGKKFLAQQTCQGTLTIFVNRYGHFIGNSTDDGNIDSSELNFGDPEPPFECPECGSNEISGSDASQGLLDFTVTVAGPERHVGEKPYTYVVKAISAVEASRAVVKMFIKEEETEDVVLMEVHEGVPLPTCGFHWNDLRKENK